MEMLRALAGELKMVAMLGFVVGTVWLYAWSSQLQAQADQGFASSAPDPDFVPRLLAQAHLDDD